MKTIDRAIKEIKTAGFGYIKVELEGHLNRIGQSMACGDCVNGQRACTVCQGRGLITETTNEAFPVTTNTPCKTCRGDGGSLCSTCDGTGRQGDWGNDSECHKYILDYVSRSLHNTTYKEWRKTVPEAGDAVHRVFNGFPGLNYGLFYNDHSVDSEYTFTVPIDEAVNLPVWIKAFQSLSETIGKGLQVTGAGMHITVLPTESGGKYPTGKRMPAEKSKNFREEVAKLLPALYFVGTAGRSTRPMQYREPEISSSRKYSAIFTHNNSCYEFRVFETCYDKPEAIYDFVSVIAKALKFHADPTLKVKSLGKEFGFNQTNIISEYFNTPEQLRILNATIKYLRPSGKTYKELKSERGLNHTVPHLKKGQKLKLSQLAADHREYVKRWNQVKDAPLSESEKKTIDYLMLDDGFSHTEAEKYVRSKRQKTLVSFVDFAKSNLNRHRQVAYITV